MRVAIVSLSIGIVGMGVLLSCVTPPTTPSASIVPPVKSYSCDFAMKLAPELIAAPPELQAFVMDYEKLRYELAAARKEPDPHCQP